jgi:hypothetical protein
LDVVRSHAEHLVGIGQYLCDLSQNFISHIPVGTQENLEQIKESLRGVRGDLSHFNLGVCVQHVDDLLQVLQERELTGDEVRSLHENIIRELATRVFLSISPEKHSYFAKPIENWEGIIKVFGNAQGDIIEMNKCYALSRYDAAVFHSLLVVEHGLIELGHHIGVTDPKAGWDATTKRLKAIVSAGHNAVPAGLDFSFLEQANSRADSMKLAWRNKVNHAAGRLVIEKTGFTDVSAEEVIIACRSFMRHLAEGLPV